MGRPYTLFVGSDETGQAEDIPEEAFVEDYDGAAMYDAEGVAEMLNNREDLTVVLPWMGDKRVCRDPEGKWFTEHRHVSARCIECGAVVNVE